MHLELTGPVGRLEAMLDMAPRAARGGADRSDPIRAAVVLGHPHPMHGGTMHTKAVFQAAKGLARIGCAVLRFNFRGVGGSEGEFDQGAGEMADYAAALDFMAARYRDAPLWAAGFSFGSWIALETGAADPRVSVLIGIAPPITKYGYTWDRTLASDKPKFFVQGDLDELCPIKIAVIDGGTHLFEGKTREVGDALEDLLGDFD
jgi:hypothetical protein